MERPQAKAGGQVEAADTGNTRPSSAHSLMTKKISDHLANERTFLALVRTGIAVMAFEFVIERFGLLFRELGLKVALSSDSSIHYSKWLGILVVILGVIMLIVAHFNFVHIRRTIDQERYKPGLLFPILLTCIASLIGFLLAIYLIITT
jgi:putative membrane protein